MQHLEEIVGGILCTILEISSSWHNSSWACQVRMQLLERTHKPLLMSQCQLLCWIPAGLKREMAWEKVSFYRVRPWKDTLIIDEKSLFIHLSFSIKSPTSREFQPSVCYFCMNEVSLLLQTRICSWNIIRKLSKVQSDPWSSCNTVALHSPGSRKQPQRVNALRVYTWPGC